VEEGLLEQSVKGAPGAGRASSQSEQDLKAHFSEFLRMQKAGGSTTTPSTKTTIESSHTSPVDEKIRQKPRPSV
jgi:hypothetical protein